METEQPTPTGGASSGDPIDRIQAWLDQSGGDEKDDQVDTSAEEVDTDPVETDKPGKDAQATDSEPQFTTAHLAAYLGLDESDIDVDEDGQPVFKTKVDGKEGTAKFSDLRKTYQLQSHAENRTREAAAREQAAERKLQEADQVIQARFIEQQNSLKALHDMNGVLQQELNGEYQSINWDALWQADAAQARALERRFEQRQARINGVAQQIQQQDAMNRQRAEHSQAQAREQFMQNQQRRLMELIPEWKDPQVAQKEVSELTSWLEKSGFDKGDIDLSRASQVALLRKSWQHETLQSQKPAIENKVRTAPKLIKPGVTTAKAEGPDASLLKSLRQQVKGTGVNSTKAGAAWLMAKGIA